MRAAIASFLAVCLWVCSICLNGCGGGGPSPSPSPSPTKKTTAIIMRHCARSMPENGITDVAGYAYFDNYSTQAWPAFDAPDWYCLSRGEKIIEQEGAWFKAHGSLPNPISVVADDCERDNVTGQAFLKGYGLPVDGTTFVTDASPFKAIASSAACPALSATAWQDTLKSQFEAYPAPDSELMALVSEIVGVGAAGEWNASQCALDVQAQTKDWWAPYKGACQAFAQFVERFLMEEGGGLSIGWGRVSSADVPKLLALHSYYFTVTLNAPTLVASSQASIAWAILRFLEAGETGTKVFAGHDTQIGGLGSGLGLSWNASPYPLNVTLPGSALRFDLEGDTVTASYVFVENYTKGGDMKSVPANLLGATDGKMSLKQLRSLVESGFVAGCANNESKHFSAKSLVV